VGYHVGSSLKKSLAQLRGKTLVRRAWGWGKKRGSGLAGDDAWQCPKLGGSEVRTRKIVDQEEKVGRKEKRGERGGRGRPLQEKKTWLGLLGYPKKIRQEEKT